ncbi:MAG: alpha/beta hydrolase domain-containing protein [Actinomycetota bacterium]
MASAAMLLAAACSSSDSASPTTSAVTSTTDTPATDVPETDAPATSTTMPAVEVPDVTISGPVAGGKGAVVLGPGGIDLSTIGYVQDEYFLSGTASSLTTPVSSAPFTTRIVVRRPKDVSAASGRVAVEWLNVTAGFDTAPDWTSAHVEFAREHWIWVGVSAQEVGIIGRDGALVPLALKLADPDRYAALDHPGDSYSYDMFSQIGAAVRRHADTLLGGAQPSMVLAFGESQSAMRLTTYINEVAAQARVFDGYFVHSRGAMGAAISQAPLADVKSADPTLFRTDLEVPVLNFITETDLLGERLAYVRARQPDTDTVHTWEVAGTSHVDLYGLGLGDTDDGSGTADAALVASMSLPPSSVYGGVISCDLPINTGPQTYVLRAAIAALAAWVESGTPPASTPLIELDAAGALKVDAQGNALGGVRSPQLDAPVARLSGGGQSGESFCGLFGTTTPFDAATLAALYPDRQTFVDRWNAAIDSAVAAGTLLKADAEALATALG